MSIIAYKNGHRLGRSLHSCLVALGADPDEVYMGGNGYRRRIERLTLRYTRDELKGWAQSLYHNAIRRRHPDHGGDHAEAVVINAAYARVKAMLR